MNPGAHRRRIGSSHAVEFRFLCYRWPSMYMSQEEDECAGLNTAKGKEHQLTFDENAVELRTVPIYHRCAFVKDLKSDDTIRVITREFDLAQDVRLLVNHARMIVDSNGPLFEYIPPVRTHYDFRILGEGKFRALMAFMKRDWDELYALFPSHSFNPYAKIFLDACKAKPKLLELAMCWPKVTSGERLMLFQQLHAFIQDLRARGRGKEFQRLLHRIARRCRKNYRAGLRYVRRIFDEGSRHLVFRWELGYSSGERIVPGDSISLAEVRKHMAKLQRYLRETFPMTGFLWKLEFGMLKGHHFHVLAFMNGHLVQQGLSIDAQIKQQWESIVTEGRGTFYSCKPGDYDEPGIGMIEYHDERKRDLLEKKVLPYLVKADFWMSYEPGGRTFGKGLMPAEAPRQGRPRSRQH